MLKNLKEGDIVRISGDSSELWIADYNTRVSTYGTIAETPRPNAKKVLVTLDLIDGDKNVCVSIRRSRLLPLLE